MKLYCEGRELANFSLGHLTFILQGAAITVTRVDLID